MITSLQTNLVSLQSSLSQLPARARRIHLLEQATVARAAVESSKQSLAVAMQQTLSAAATATPASSATTAEVLHTHMQSLVDQAELALTRALSQMNITLSVSSEKSSSERYAWLLEQESVVKQHMTSLDHDISRVEQELAEITRSVGSAEGQLKEVSELKQDYETVVETLKGEVIAEYQNLGIPHEVSDEGLSELMSDIVYRTGSQTASGSLTISLLELLNKHYLVLQMQSRIDSVNLKHMVLTNQLKVGIL